MRGQFKWSNIPNPNGSGSENLQRNSDNDIKEETFISGEALPASSLIASQAWRKIPRRDRGKLAEGVAQLSMELYGEETGGKVKAFQALASPNSGDAQRVEIVEGEIQVKMAESEQRAVHGIVPGVRRN
ncbi:hypothetical protein Nepgr_030489 [Nepenthes gracilis]|uniref:Uncharacterized protein n=1 Tax=Nepenthes gracilis TaxID=150966 RepID=A0AAD3TGA6_NEPGR|nr:hypothetical protein Nepgr_030489 [Nepenthes gracilis]